jgi:hypothetical protein
LNNIVARTSLPLAVEQPGLGHFERFQIYFLPLNQSFTLVTLFLHFNLRFIPIDLSSNNSLFTLKGSQLLLLLEERPDLECRWQWLRRYCNNIRAVEVWQIRQHFASSNTAGRRRPKPLPFFIKSNGGIIAVKILSDNHVAVGGDGLDKQLVGLALN